MKERLAVAVMILAIPFAVPFLRSRESSPTTPSLHDRDMIALRLAEAPRDADVIFLGDSITERWHFRPQLWNKYFGKAANLGIGGSCVGDVLGLVELPQMQEFHPKVVVLLAGSNDIGAFHQKFYQQRAAAPDSIVAGINLVVRKVHGARAEDIARAGGGVIGANPAPPSQTIPGTGISVGPSTPVTGMQGVLPAKSKLTFTVTSSN